MAKKTGRPSKFDPATAEVLITALRLGAYVETAAAYAGITKDTFYRWLRDGARGKTAALAAFSDAVKKAGAEGEVRALARIQEASKKEWTAAAWYLERRNPAEWGRKRLEITGADGGPVQVRARIYLPDNGRGDT